MFVFYFIFIYKDKTITITNMSRTNKKYDKFSLNMQNALKLIFVYYNYKPAELFVIH